MVRIENSQSVLLPQEGTPLRELHDKLLGQIGEVTVDDIMISPHVVANITGDLHLRNESDEIVNYGYSHRCLSNGGRVVDAVDYPDTPRGLEELIIAALLYQTQNPHVLQTMRVTIGDKLETFALFDIPTRQRDTEVTAELARFTSHPIFNALLSQELAQIEDIKERKYLPRI